MCFFLVRHSTAQSTPLPFFSTEASNRQAALTDLMASPRSLLKLALTVALIFSIALRLPTSVLAAGGESLLKKTVLGSKPPGCVGKCLNCRPCSATLVVPVHHESKGFEASSGREDGSYYLLHWKCRCGDKLYQP